MGDLLDSSADDVIATRAEGIVTITLDRPDKRNALTRSMRARLDALLAAADADATVRVVILTGAGSAFCAGVDLGEGPAGGSDDSATSPPAVTASLDAFAKPAIAAMNGHAMGGGLELALACDLRVVADGARLGLPEVRIGSLPGSGGISRLARLVPAGLAARVALTGDPIDAATALDAGLVSEVLPADQVVGRARELAERIAGAAPLSVLAAKRSLRAAAERPLSEGIAADRAAWAELAGSADRAEGRAAFRDGRPPRFTGQ